MTNLLSLVAALIISMVLIPLMVRMAPRFGLLDRPDARKVHATPIPRVGGVGIVVGSLVSIVFLLPLDQLTLAYVLGGAVLFLFGVWDDMADIGHYTKFLGQLIAVLVLVLYGGLYVTTFPFVPGGEIAPAFGVPFTVIAMVGVINAVNLSDGLDGLASGESLISFGAMVVLAFLSENAGAAGVVGFTVALTAIGGVLGFLRYNTHPARVFMGDSGSQFLGYTLGFLAILLTQKIDTGLSPAVVLLLIGLPVVDSLVVMAKRARQGVSMFKATRDHIHHRLLDLGFVHQESVVAIYSAQIVFVTSGILLRYVNDWIIAGVYMALCLGIFGMIIHAENSGWSMGQGRRDRDQAVIMAHDVLRNILVILPRRFLLIGIPFYFIATSLSIDSVPPDFAKLSLLILGLLVLEMLFGSGPRSITHRALIYVLAAFVGYLGVSYSPTLQGILEPLKTAFFVLTAIAFAIAVRFSPKRRKTEFRTTATDYLVAFCMLAVLAVSKGKLWGSEGIAFVVQMVVIFYACELLITEKRAQPNNGLMARSSILSLAALITATILVVRGLLFAQ